MDGAAQSTTQECSNLASQTALTAGSVVPLSPIVAYNYFALGAMAIDLRSFHAFHAERIATSYHWIPVRAGQRPECEHRAMVVFVVDDALAASDTWAIAATAILTELQARRIVSKAATCASIDIGQFKFSYPGMLATNSAPLAYLQLPRQVARCEATELFVGGFEDAGNLSMLQCLGITHILLLGRDQEFQRLNIPSSIHDHVVHFKRIRMTSATESQAWAISHAVEWLKTYRDTALLAPPSHSGSPEPLRFLVCGLGARGPAMHAAHQFVMDINQWTAFETTEWMRDTCGVHRSLLSSIHTRFPGAAAVARFDPRTTVPNVRS
eukprot:m.352714 g.352714  ORF g.352714 m.352714 type:complete len:324 (+) comp16599_c0_seq1:1024-1995(+)